jgi:catechol 2,3-dioxygenase-like lactoylglutathione lyase family enzyme
MAITLNHTIVPTHDKEASARFFVKIFGLKYEGANEIGPQMDINPFKLAFKSGKSLNPISDEWSNIEIEGEALANDLGKFGTWTIRE